MDAKLLKERFNEVKRKFTESIERKTSKLDTQCEFLTEEVYVRCESLLTMMRQAADSFQEELEASNKKRREDMLALLDRCGLAELDDILSRLEHNDNFTGENLNKKLREFERKLETFDYFEANAKLDFCEEFVITKELFGSIEFCTDRCIEKFHPARLFSLDEKPKKIIQLKNGNFIILESYLDTNFNEILQRPLNEFKYNLHMYNSDFVFIGMFRNVLDIDDVSIVDVDADDSDNIYVVDDKDKKLFKCTYTIEIVDDAISKLDFNPILSVSIPNNAIWKRLFIDQSKKKLYGLIEQSGVRTVRVFGLDFKAITAYTFEDRIDDIKVVDSTLCASIRMDDKIKVFNLKEKNGVIECIGEYPNRGQPYLTFRNFFFVYDMRVKSFNVFDKTFKLFKKIPFECEFDGVIKEMKFIGRRLYVVCDNNIYEIPTS